MTRYDDVFSRSVENPDAFWREVGSAISWDQEPVQTCELGDRPVAEWFSGGRLNSCFNAVDRHVAAGRGDQPALVYDSPATATQLSLTYRELQDRVARFAGALSGLGVDVGSRVLIYMPMTPEAVITMLACARIGAIHSVVFGGFGAQELAARIAHCEPTVIVAASCGFEPTRTVDYLALLNAALERSAYRPEHFVIARRKNDPAPGPMPAPHHDWHALLESAKAAPPASLPANAPLYILYTSGTTGQPKGVVRDNGGHAVALAWSMRHVYDVGAGDVFWAASDIGWVVGHSYCVYGPLLAGATTVIYEGKPVGTPDAGAFWRVISDHSVAVLFAAPTAFRAIRREDPDASLARAVEMPALRSVFVAGERLDLGTSEWLSQHLGVPIVDHWWQTETGWPITGTCLALGDQPKPGTVGRPMPGYRLVVQAPDGGAAPPGTEGPIVLKPPLPPGALMSLWQDEDRFRESYFDSQTGTYRTGDSGIIDDEGYLTVTGRADDVLSVAGHRLSPGAIEQALNRHPAIAESAVVGANDPLKGELPLAFVVFIDLEPEELPTEAELRDWVRGEVGAIATPSRVLPTTRLPKTRSGKILRRTIRELANGRNPTVPATIEDPSAVDEIRAALA